MFSRPVCIVLLVIALACASAFGIEPNVRVVPPEVTHISGLVQKLGTGEAALVAVRLKDKTATSGYIAEAGPDYMIVVDPKTGEESKVSFYKIDRLQGYNISTRSEVHHRTGFRSRLVRLAMKGLPTHQVPRNGFAHSTALIVGVILGLILAIVLAKVF
ncbi:MAG TPA: hypothetical protein VG897_19020 [Terriglobales bacterium]|nr:hypothetical protein [Terriglobales bacterium]